MVSATPKTRTIPQGTIVSSYLLHADFPGPSPDPTGTTIGGTWTFDDPILAVSYTQSGLATGDNLVGHPDITYEQASTARGLETGGSDIVRVSPTDPNTLIVEFAFNAMDEIRVWTGVINPPICDPSPTNPIVAAFPPADLSQDGADPDPALAYEHDACLFVFDEGEHTLSQAVNPVAPKTTTNMVVANPGTRRIPAGTVVETFLIHGDALGPTPSPTGAEITATWTFDQPILAVSYRRDGLLIGDGLVGHPAITYDTNSRSAASRSVRPTREGLADRSKDTMMTFAYNAMDEIRVWTGVIGPQPGTIRVVKDSTPDSGQDVAFTTTDLDPAEFALDDDGEATLPSSMSFSTAPGDGYAVSETVPAGWDLTSATCDDGSPVTNIDVSSGETVTCTFHNVQRGRIVIVKQVLPDGSPETFDFDPSWGPNFTLGDGESHEFRAPGAEPVLGGRDAGGRLDGRERHVRRRVRARRDRGVAWRSRHLYVHEPAGTGPDHRREGCLRRRPELRLQRVLGDQRVQPRQRGEP